MSKRLSPFVLRPVLYLSFHMYLGNILMLWFSKIFEIVMSNTYAMYGNTSYKFYTSFLSSNDYLCKSRNVSNATKWSNFYVFKPLLHWSRGSIQTFLLEKHRWQFFYHPWQVHTKSTVPCHFALFVCSVGGMLGVEGSKTSTYNLPVFLACPTGSWGKKLASLTAE